MLHPGGRLPVVRRKGLVVAVLGGQVLTAPLAMPTQSGGVTGELHVGDVQAAVSPGEPRVAEFVIDDGEGIVSDAGVDVLRPQRPAFIQVLVGVDDGRHLSPVGLNNSDPDGSSHVGMGHAARTYSLISPPRISFRSIRVFAGTPVGSVEKVAASGGRWPRERCGRCLL